MDLRFPSPRHIFWVRPDAVSDNVLATAMLPHIRAAFADARISVFCQDIAAELYQTCPFVDEIVTFNLVKFEREAAYREAMIHGLQARAADLCLNSVYSRTALTDFVSYATQAARRVAFEGGLENMPPEVRDKNNRLYTDLVANGPAHLPELARHDFFLRGIGIEAAPLAAPLVWLTDEDERFAEAFFRDNALDPHRTVALFGGAASGVQRYEHYGVALRELCREQQLGVVALGAAQDITANQANLDAAEAEIAHNLSGQTTLRQSAAILRRCRVAVGGETGLGHLACAVGTSNVIVLGGGYHGRFLPYAPQTSVVSLPLDCYGCRWSCRYATVHCVQDISPAVVTAAIRATLARSSPLPRVFVPKKERWPHRAGLPQWQAPTESLAGSNAEIIEIDGVSPGVATPGKAAPPNVAPPIAAPAPAASAQATYQRAVALAEIGQLDAAARLLRTLTDVERLCALVRNDLGAIAHRLGRPLEALAEFERAVLLDPTNVNAHKNLADVYVQLGRHDQAIAVLERATGLAPADAEIAAQLQRLSLPGHSAATH
ncbi:MAG TPA: glycosyltransferase family 9 protein [Polyangia bacterium]|jgi:ADP-heptose:LPS heptosyltransferase|nr:glycosyltransferase family 9 protein [Polyangia bacterium]